MTIAIIYFLMNLLKRKYIKNDNSEQGLFEKLFKYIYTLLYLLFNEKASPFFTNISNLEELSRKLQEDKRICN